MKTFSSVVTLLVSIGAIALSGLTFFKVSTLEKQLPEQIALAVEETLAASSFAELDTAETLINTSTDSENSAALSSETATDEEAASNDTDNPSDSPSAASEPLVSTLAHQDSVQIEIVSVQRLSDAESGGKGIVNVNLRVKRADNWEEIEQNGGPSSFYLSGTKGRNAKTNAVYTVPSSRYTDSQPMSKLSSEVWSDAYFWLRNVPEDLQELDIVFRDTAIIEGVPISD